MAKMRTSVIDVTFHQSSRSCERGVFHRYRYVIRANENFLGKISLYIQVDEKLPKSRLQQGWLDTLDRNLTFLESPWTKLTNGGKGKIERDKGKRNSAAPQSLYNLFKVSYET